MSYCISCILAEKKWEKKKSELRPISKGDTPLSTYHLGSIATLKLYKYLFVVVDDFSKFVWIYLMKTMNAREVLKKLQSQQKVFGNLCRIISDQDSAFMSNDFQSYCFKEKRISNTSWLSSLEETVKKNGQVERVNCIIILILTKLS